VLPLIVIGADERTAAAFQQCPVPIQPCRFYEDTERAVYALNDELGAAVVAGYVVDSGQDQPGLVEFDRVRNGWRANVAYGPKVLGLAATGQPVKLAHTGWTLVLTWGKPDQSAPRRMVGDQPQGQDESTVALQAAPMLAANMLIDLSVSEANGTYFPGLVGALGQMKQRIEP
jgi:hypothetical protein